MRRPMVGVMGGGQVSGPVLEAARELGRLIARRGWILLNGGRDAGVMAASTQGAKQAGGLVVGVLPDRDASQVCPEVDIAIVTGMGDARNAINVLSSDVVIACCGGAGTLSEVALALKSGKPVILLGFDPAPTLAPYTASGQLTRADHPTEAVDLAAALLG